MAWWEQIMAYLQSTGLDDIHGGLPAEAFEKKDKKNKAPKGKGLREMLDEVFFEESLDMMYFWLGIFSYVYFFATALLYLGALSNVESVASKLISALAEPYLGTVGIYTILKEHRKRSRRVPAKHWGELFVAGWLALLVVSSFLAFFFKAYTFNGTLEEIITISLAVGIIYVGSLIHKP